MGILSIDINNINLDDTNYDEGDPETVIHIRLLAWHRTNFYSVLLLMHISSIQYESIGTF